MLKKCATLCCIVIQRQSKVSIQESEIGNWSKCLWLSHNCWPGESNHTKDTAVVWTVTTEPGTATGHCLDPDSPMLRNPSSWLSHIAFTQFWWATRYIVSDRYKQTGHELTCAKQLSQTSFVNKAQSLRFCLVKNVIFFDGEMAGNSLNSVDVGVRKEKEWHL